MLNRDIFHNILLHSDRLNLINWYIAFQPEYDISYYINSLVKCYGRGSMYSISDENIYTEDVILSLYTFLVNKIRLVSKRFKSKTVTWHLHREDGPAICIRDLQMWFERGKLHRTDGPAVIYKDLEVWCHRGYIHRENGPAYTNKYKIQYRIMGQKHREDGPAVIYIPYNTIKYYYMGKLHRVDGPAIIDYDEDEEIWYYMGKLHRIGGPAISIDGVEEWYRHGQLHRDDGPAVTRGDVMRYYIYGNRVSPKKIKCMK